jgi:hypothetical protein
VVKVVKVVKVATITTKTVTWEWLDARRSTLAIRMITNLSQSITDQELIYPHEDSPLSQAEVASRCINSTSRQPSPTQGPPNQPQSLSLEGF